MSRMHEQVRGLPTMASGRPARSFEEHDMALLLAAPAFPEDAEVAPKDRLDALTAAGREFVHAVNNGLCLPLGVLELLAQQSTIPEDMRTLIRAAREGLQLTVDRAQEFESVVRASA
jgi:hypothetical protein